jgi:8-oxo-dGTP diphosphatase
MKEYTVVAAIIRKEDTFLCVQRNKGKYDYISYKWEFPGGKVEPGESKSEAIKREILEELEMDIEVVSEAITVNHQYPDFKLIMHALICTSNTLEPKLNEHISHEWLTKNDLGKLDWAAADIPIVDYLISN